MIIFFIQLIFIFSAFSIAYLILQSNKLFTMLVFFISGVSLWYLFYLIPMYAFSVSGTVALLIAIMSKPVESNGDVYQALKNLSKHRSRINI